MKRWIIYSCIFMISPSFAQNYSSSFAGYSFSKIDRIAGNIDAETPAKLAISLTEPYVTEMEKVRSIFSWITANVTYNVRRYKKSPTISYQPFTNDNDTGALPNLNERVSVNILKSREAVCDGYARLFKNLCDHAGIRAELIHGYAKVYGRPSRFSSNHAWNAVFIDSAWYLLDVTWAAGFINSQTNEYVSSQNDKYFLADPKDFIVDHYPEDLKWTLLSQPPVIKEFQKNPYLYAAFTRRQVTDFFPKQGTLQATVGDTIRVELESQEPLRHLFVTDSLYVDTATIASVEWQNILKEKGVKQGNRSMFYYVVETIASQWLHVIYNGEVIIRYGLIVKAPEEVLTAGK